LVAGTFSARYDACVIRNPDEYRHESERDRWNALERMTPEDSIAVGEALLTSEIMNLAVFPRDDAPRSLAIALGIEPRVALWRSGGGGAAERV
jgi:hypothetical protein